MNAKDEIENSGREMVSRYNDGFTAFYHKQKILQTFWECEYWLKHSPNFTGEEEWIEENRPKKLDD